LCLNKQIFKMGKHMLQKGRLFHCKNITFVMFKECSISFKEVQYYSLTRSSTSANVTELTRRRPVHCNNIYIYIWHMGSNFHRVQLVLQRSAELLSKKSLYNMFNSSFQDGGPLVPLHRYQNRIYCMQDLLLKAVLSCLKSMWFKCMQHLKL